MKSLKFNSIILMSLMILLCLPSFLFAKAEEKLEQVYPLNRAGKVYLENVSGDIVIKSWKKNEVKILARKVARKDGDLDNVTIDINQTDGYIRIITRYEKFAGMFKSENVSVHYDLTIPDEAHLRVKTVSGSVEALNIGGPVDIETVSGKIDIVRAEKGVKCKSISGSLYLEDITGDTYVKSTSGKISIEGVKGSVEANNVSGSVTLNSVSMAEEIMVESISGSIKVQGELSPGGIYEFKTISGGTKIDLPPESDFEFHMTTMSGSLRFDPDDFIVKVLNNPARNKVQGIVGEGSATLKTSSLSGGITIK